MNQHLSIIRFTNSELQWCAVLGQSQTNDEFMSQKYLLSEYSGTVFTLT